MEIHDHAGDRRPLSLLIVDDSAMMRAMLKRAAALSAVPLAAIHEACNGAEALKVLAAHPVDAVFTDLNMPVMDGIELLKAIDRQERWERVLRVIISSDGADAPREEASRLRAHRYVEKPFNPEAIRDVLTSVA